MKPLLKWPGGKARLAPLISEAFGKPCEGTYYEPFLGSGAVFLHRKAAGEIVGAILSDVNPNLVNFHQMIQQHPQQVIARLRKSLPADFRERYYKVRDSFNDPQAIQSDPCWHAAAMLWLNKTCFNGLYRVNKKGEFNASLGSYTTLNLPSDEEILAVSALLQGAKILLSSSSHILQGFAFYGPSEGDQVYCDPPYDSGFVGYSADGFNEGDQLSLAGECEYAAAHGARVVVSNSDTELTRRLYAEEDGWKIRELSVQRSISQSKERKKAGEILATLGGQGI